jgi:hypothetical protein
MFNDSMQYIKERDLDARENAMISLFNQQLLVQAISNLAIAFTKTSANSTPPKNGPTAHTTTAVENPPAPQVSTECSDHLDLKAYPAGHSSMA